MNRMSNSEANPRGVSSVKEAPSRERRMSADVLQLRRTRLQRVAAFLSPHDPLLFGMCMVATILGAFIIFDAGYARSIRDSNGIIPREFKSQVLQTFIAVFLGLIVAKIPIAFYRRHATALFVACSALVLSLSIPGVGKTQSGSKRWIDLGYFDIQPSEFAKVGVIVFLAAILAARKPWQAPKKRFRTVQSWLQAVAPLKLWRALPLLWVGLVAFKIEREPDLGTAAVVMVIALAMLALGGVSRKSMVALVALGAVGAIGMASLEPYRVERITNHFHRWEPKNMDEVGYQTVQSEMGMADGGILGVGIGQGRIKHMISAPTNDFIMGTIAEEFGLIGALVTIALIGAIVWRLIERSRKAVSRFGELVLLGTAAWFGIQSCVNIMMANGFLPAIGIPLPFFSSGGSSLLALWIAIGLCQAATAEKMRAVTVLEDRRDGRRDGRAHLSGSRSSA